MTDLPAPLAADASAAVATTVGTGAIAFRPQTPSEVRDAFLASKSGNTRSAYENCLNDFGRFLDAHGVPAFAVSRAVVDAYVADLTENRKLAAATVAQRLAALSGFYEYAVDEGLIPRSPVTRVKRPKIGRDSPRLGLDAKEVERFLRAAREAGPRDYAFACLGILNGLRVSEICGANAEDLGEVLGHHVLRVTRKGGAKVNVPLAPATYRAVLETLDGRTGPIFLNANGDRLDRNAARNIMTRLARKAGIKKRLSPHSLRHTFVTQALEEGIELHVVQDDAGHADPRTTQRYNRGRHSLAKASTYRLAARFAAEDAA